MNRVAVEFFSISDKKVVERLVFKANKGNSFSDEGVNKFIAGVEKKFKDTNPTSRYRIAKIGGGVFRFMCDKFSKST